MDEERRTIETCIGSCNFAGAAARTLVEPENAMMGVIAMNQIAFHLIRPVIWSFRRQ